MPFCKTCNKDFPSSDFFHIQNHHEIFVSNPNITKINIARFFNHYLVEPGIWAISLYGIALGIIATYEWGFFTLKEYTLGSLVFFLSPAQVQSFDLWYDAYPYSLIIFGSYLLLLYISFRPKGYLALPVFTITYATWDFLGIGTNIISGYSIIWLGISALGLIYYLPVHKQFKIQVPFLSLLIFFAIGILYLPDLFLTRFPFDHTLIYGHPLSQYFGGIANEASFCYLCLTSIKLKSKT